MFNIEANPIDELSRKIEQIIMTSGSLIGEVFTEEERRLTRTYEAVIRLISEGLWDLSEIASILSSRGLISGGRESITGILNVLNKIGIIAKIPLWNDEKVKKLRDVAEKLGIRRIGVISLGKRYEGKAEVDVTLEAKDLVRISREILNRVI
ncbi:MAG: hypothetical protein J7J27_01890 [Euryarchaeota archaeon]|nr:hypothetical protein [Euryarchaeota archaeon]